MNHVRIMSRRMVLPEPTSLPPEPETTIDLTPWDLSMIALEYNQKGVLLPNPPATEEGEGRGHHAVVQRLASSFARALGRFYPYAGRLAVTPGNNADGEPGESIAIWLRCSMEGAEFVHAVAPGVTVADVNTPLCTPTLVRSFFPLDGLHGVDAAAGSHPLLAVQVTELDDGVFVGMSLNHAVADGSALWHLFNTWSEMSRQSDGAAISSPLPVHRRWFLDGCPVPVPLPFGKLEDMPVSRRTTDVEHPSSVKEECFLNFSGEMVKKLKAKANGEMPATTTISSLQAVLAHLWIAVTRARRLAPDHSTTYVILVGCRGRVDGLPAAYAGNAVARAEAVSTAGEILERGLGFAASLLNRAVGSFDVATQRDRHASWPQEHYFLRARPTATAKMVTGGSPRFDVYGNDFGWGRPVGVRSGRANKMDGTATVFEGTGGGGSMALGVWLPPEVLASLVADEEFMSGVSTVTA
ncbi:hypothetical protein CFC21_027368 [Triticum aestivum]|uniref:Acetyltransferase n=2 Tax=Triticum aestivum TaxID=4565 RepID=A0A3B6D5B7_WHEAT|nr:uncharacterized acetyltransferase At3g50280-like [Triticum aestivum]KAF7013275.1 hypothetical protein CFC21_027368 [Triticum aestivum]